MKNTYYLLRHGETPYQKMEERMIYPWPEPEPILLTEKGKKEIKRAAQKLKDKSIDLIFSSPYSRTRQSAGIVGKELGLKVNFDERLREMNQGVFRGKPQKELLSHLLEDGVKGDFNYAPPEGESWSEVKERVLDFLRELEERYKGKNILIVSHGDPLWLLEGGAKGKSEKELLLEKRGDKTIDTGEIRKL